MKTANISEQLSVIRPTKRAGEHIKKSVGRLKITAQKGKERDALLAARNRIDEILGQKSKPGNNHSIKELGDPI